MKKILVAISDSFPYGAAYAARTRALCKLFNAVGYETDILCDYLSEDGESKEYGNVYSVAAHPYLGIKKLISLPNDYARKLEVLVAKKKYDYIVARSMFDRFGKVLAVARKYNMPIILESCEWYDVRGFRFGKYDIRYHQFQHCFKILYNRVNGVIAISRLLEEHYRNQGIPVIRIPGIHDVDTLPFRTDVSSNNGINLIFGGNVFGGKEKFSELLTALHAIEAHKKEIYLHVYGSGKDEVIASLDEHAKTCYTDLKGYVVFYGQVPQIEMAQACMNNDFGVFFRPDRRSSHAGFPTKLGEYLAAGTPVITNDTGDVSLVIEDGKNGFLLSDCSVDTIQNVLEKCVSMSFAERIEMRKNARLTAQNVLSYKVYQAEVEDFLNGVLDEYSDMKIQVY